MSTGFNSLIDETSKKRLRKSGVRTTCNERPIRPNRQRRQRKRSELKVSLTSSSSKKVRASRDSLLVIPRKSAKSRPLIEELLLLTE